MNLPAHTWRRNSNAVARSWNWSADNITIQQLMTHAEAASNRDGRAMHDNYGPVIWGGTGEVHLPCLVEIPGDLNDEQGSASGLTGFA